MRHRNLSLRSLTLPLAALSLAPTAFAIHTSAGYSVTSVSSVSGSYSLDSYYGDGPFDTGAENQFFDGAYGWRASVQATSYGLHAENITAMENRDVVNNNVPESESLRSSAGATVRLDDCIVTGTGTAPVRTRISMLFEGGLETTTLFYSSPRMELAEMDSYASASIQLTANNKSIIPDSLVALEHQIGYSKASSIGALEGFKGKQVVVSDVFTVIPNQPFSVQFGLSTRASVGFNDVSVGRVHAAADFAHTYSFATDRPVFELPDGYTMNSVSGHIVNNRFIPEAVPEPGTVAALGLGAVALLRRRKRA